MKFCFFQVAMAGTSYSFLQRVGAIMVNLQICFIWFFVKSYMTNLVATYIKYNFLSCFFFCTFRGTGQSYLLLGLVHLWYIRFFYWLEIFFVKFQHFLDFFLTMISLISSFLFGKVGVTYDAFNFFHILYCSVVFLTYFCRSINAWFIFLQDSFAF